VKEKMNRKKRMLALVGSVMLALLGTLGLVKYVQSARNRVVNSETTSKIFVAKSSIKAGTSSKDLALRVEAIGVPERLQQPGAVKNLDEIKDLVNTTDLLQGEQLIKARFDSAASSQSPEIALAGLTPGSNEMTLRLAPERALGGALRPGDTVTVVASFQQTKEGEIGESVTLFNKVVIVRVQSADSSREASNKLSRTEVERKVVAAPTEELLVTVAVDQTNLPKLAFAAEFGKIWLSFEPQVVSGSSPGAVNLNDVLGSRGGAAAESTTAELVSSVPGQGQ
jgi:pilus assembly protein CpaB